MTRPSGIDIGLMTAGVAVAALAMILVAVVPAPTPRASSGTSVTQAVAAFDAGHYRRARRILDPMVTAGNPDAETWLGYMDEHGFGADANLPRAMALFTKASASDFARADRELGEIYLNGQGVLQNVAAARQWLQLGADRGDAAAQRELGEIYLKGMGVPKDPSQAYVWLAIAASHGDETAASERDALLPSLPPATASQAEDQAQRTLAAITPPAAPTAPASAKS